MRIKLSKPKEFFNEILAKKDKNLKQLSEIISVNYSALKKYRRGNLLIPEELFKKLLEFSDNKTFWENNLEMFKENWGASKAGKISALKDKEHKRIAYARTFKKIKKLRIPSIPYTEFFCEFYGALLGDGCISRLKDWEGKERMAVFISGNKKLDSNYLTYLKKKLKEELKISSYFYQYKNKNVCLLTIRNKGVALSLNKLGFPIGKKYGKIKIPNKIIKLPWKMQKMIIRGIFDTDGSICAKKREGYKYPQICLTSIDQKLLKQLYKILREKGYPCWIGGPNIFIRSNWAVKKWFEDVGSSNNRNIFKYRYWLKNNILPKGITGL